MDIQGEPTFEKEAYLKITSERFNALLKKNKFTSTNKFADAHGFSRGTIHKLSKGHLNITAWSLFRICEALDMTCEEFFKELY
ncbi:MAG: helix-turn-helix transcriptional regulator [Candidatus Margulisbacteria bacterium]|nr:helix-turn-helix transcriptional regulator [Candidatus Margulisiibacteriota bacterium]